MNQPAIPHLPRSLLRRSPLEAGESLPSFLVRLAVLNGYSSPSILERLIAPQYPDRPDCPSQRPTFERLAILTGVSPLDLYAASDHCFTQSNLPERWPMNSVQAVPLWETPPLSSVIHPTQTSWYCPKCLQVAAYHRVIWRPVALSACLEHHCLLVNHCPQCQKPVSLEAIVRTRCQHCEADLRQASVMDIQEDEMGQVAQAAMRGWLMGYPVPDHHWPLQPAPALSGLADGLALGMLYLPPAGPFDPRILDTARQPHHIRFGLQRLEPYQVFHAYAAAVQCMMDWPDGFRRFLYWCEPDPQCDLQVSQRILYTHWAKKRWNSEVFHFIWEAVHEFHTDRLWFATGVPDQDTPFSRLPEYAHSWEAARILGIAENAVLRLGQMGLLARLDIRRLSTVQPFFLRRELRKMKQSWNEPLSLAETAGWLGLSTETVIRLRKEGLLKACEKAPLLDEPEVHFSKNAAAGFVSRVDACARNVYAGKGYIPLQLAAQQLACVHLDEAKLLKLVVSRELAAYRSLLQQQCWECGKISFERKDLDVVMDRVARQKGWLSLEEAALRLGVADSVCLDWIERGILKQVAVYQEQPYLKQREMDRFLSQYIFFEEAAVLLDFSWKRLMRFIQRGKIRPVAGPGVDRCERYLLPRRKVEKLAERLKARAARAK